MGSFGPVVGTWQLQLEYKGRSERNNKRRRKWQGRCKDRLAIAHRQPWGKGVGAACSKSVLDKEG